MVEFLGIVASTIIAISFFLNGEKNIRVVNMLGSILFMTYGVLISSASVIFLNAVSIIVNIIKICKLSRRK